MLLAGAAPWLSGPRSAARTHPAVPRVPNRAQPLALSTTCGCSASQAGGVCGGPPGRYWLPPGAPVKRGGRRAAEPGLPLPDSPAGKLGNLLLPNVFLAREFSPRSALGTSPIQLLVHTCCSPPTQQMPAKALVCHQGNGAVPGALAAACQPAKPRGAGTGSPQSLPPAGAASRSAAGPGRLPG